MDIKRWGSNSPLSTLGQYEGLGVPVTAKDGKDYLMDNTDIAKAALLGTPDGTKIATEKVVSAVGTKVDNVINGTTKVENAKNADIATSVIDGVKNQSKELIATVQKRKKLFEKASWYRVAKLDTYHSNCTLYIGNRYSNFQVHETIINILGNINNQEDVHFMTFSNYNAEGYPTFTKVRLAQDTKEDDSVKYVEVYYNTDTANLVEWSIAGNAEILDGAINASEPFLKVESLIIAEGLSINGVPVAKTDGIIAQADNLTSIRWANKSANDITKSGVYYGFGMTDTPYQQGIIVASVFAESSIQYQTFYTVEPSGEINHMYIRQQNNNGKWINWQELTTTKTAKTLIVDEVIPENTNYDTITTIGNYSSGSTSNIQTCTNTPFDTDPFDMTVEEIYPGYLVQTAVAITTSNTKMKMRGKLRTHEWSDWQMVTNESYPYSYDEITKNGTKNKYVLLAKLKKTNNLFVAMKGYIGNVGSGLYLSPFNFVIREWSLGSPVFYGYFYPTEPKEKSDIQLYIDDTYIYIYHVVTYSKSYGYEGLEYIESNIPIEYEEFTDTPIGTYVASMYDSLAGKITDNATMTTAGTTDDSVTNVGKVNEIAAEHQRVGPGRNILTVLGASSVSDAFKKMQAMKSSGNYGDLRIGDYVDIPSLDLGTGGGVITSGVGVVTNGSNRLRVEILGFDHYKNVGYPNAGGAGILFGFRNCVALGKMNSTEPATNAGGYKACEMRKYLRGEFATNLEKALGITLQPINRLLETHGSWDWDADFPDKVWLPTEVEVFGYQAWGRGGYYGGTSAQYPIYALDPSRRIKNWGSGKTWWWEGTSSSSNSSYFCGCDGIGYADNNTATYAYGVAPAFYI